MDVGSPNNFPRLLHLCRNRLNTFSAKSGVTARPMKRRLARCDSVHQRFNYIADPTGVLGWELYRREHPEPAQGSIATAHPAKFADVVQRAIGHRAAARPPRGVPEEAKAIAANIGQIRVLSF